MDLQRRNLGYSLKNIPIPSKSTYKKILLVQVEKLVKRFRWTVHFFNKHQEENKKEEEEDKEDQELFGFKSSRTPQQQPELADFEEDIYRLIRNIKYRQVKNAFQCKLSRDINQMKKSGKIIVKADKTTNLYHVTTQDYEKLVTDNITKDYKKAAVCTRCKREH